MQPMHNSAGVGLSLTSRRLQTGNNQCASAEPPYRPTAGLRTCCCTVLLTLKLVESPAQLDTKEQLVQLECGWNQTLRRLTIHQPDQIVLDLPVSWLYSLATLCFRQFATLYYHDVQCRCDKLTFTDGQTRHSSFYCATLLKPPNSDTRSSSLLAVI